MDTVIGKFVLTLAGVLLVVALCAFPVKWLWNWLMPELFALKQITFWQALGLLALSSMLLKTSSGSSK